MNIEINLGVIIQGLIGGIILFVLSRVSTALSDIRTGLNKLNARTGVIESRIEMHIEEDKRRFDEIGQSIRELRSERPAGSI